MANNIFTELLAWSKDLAPWQNEAIRRLFANGTLSAQDLDELFILAQIECGLKAPPSAYRADDLMLKNIDLPTPPTAGQRIELKAVRDFENVNAIKLNQRLAVGKHMTIIYGENASGKSGFARVMKKAFRARAVDPVIPNIYAGAKPTTPASAIFEIEENGKVRDEKWIDGVQKPDCLGRFAVLDSRCARVYIAENNQLDFRPYGFDIIEGLGTVTTEIKRRFQEVADRAAPKPETLKPFLDNTSVGKAISSLGSQTKLEDIKAKAIWTAADDDLFKTKKIEHAKLVANSPQTIKAGLLSYKKSLMTVRSSLVSLASALSSRRIEAIKHQADDLSRYEQAVSVAAKAAFGDLNLPGVGGDVWRELILAAQNFATQHVYPGQPYPTDAADVKCVLCLRPLDQESRQRLKNFWAFVQDDTSAKRDRTKTALATDKGIISQLPKGVPAEVHVLEDALKANSPELLEAIRSYYKHTSDRIESVTRAIDSGNWSGVPSEMVAPLDLCDKDVGSVDKRVLEIADDAAASKTLEALVLEISEMDARKRLAGGIQTVEDYLNKLRLSVAAAKAAGGITTNAISIKAGQLQQTFVTEEFRKRVSAELQPLGLIRLHANVNRKSEKGRVLHRLVVESAPDVPLESVFSESERTALAIACFLAELGAMDDNSGIVLDDPVSSFDHRIRESVVDRLVKEATKRQVIIFTHDLVFYRDLIRSSARQQVEVAFQSVAALGPVTGMVTTAPPWDTQKVGPRTAKLDEVLGKAKAAENAGDIAVYRPLFREFYSLLRSTWERSVEELLFNEVVQRLEKEVKTLRLDGVRVDNEGIQAVSDGMTRSSAMIDAHDHAIAQNSSLSSSADMVSDLKAFKDFVAKQKEKSKIAAKENAHLKK